MFDAMSAAEERLVIQRIMRLYRNRGQEKTPDDVRREGVRVQSLLRCSPQEAYDNIEQHVMRKIRKQA